MTRREKMQLTSVRIKHLELINKAIDTDVPFSFVELGVRPYEPVPSLRGWSSEDERLYLEQVEKTL